MGERTSLLRTLVRRVEGRRGHVSISTEQAGGVTYAKILQRVADAYPYGPIQFPKEDSLTGSAPTTGADATCQFATAKGSVIRFGEGVRALRGDTKLTSDGAGCVIAVGARTTFENSHVQINGENCAVIIGEDCRLRGLKIVVRRKHSIVVIGAKTTWESGAVISESGNMVIVGEDCMMSNSVILRTSDGHTIFDSVSKTPINEPADVYIGHHVGLGNGARVNKGTSIGSGSIVGQSSIASGVIAGNCVYAGVPARRIRDKVVWSRTTRYEDIPEEFLT